ncbi:MAG: gliding motility-associated C-terminal domain-containing protein [Bacteroidales bacterium]|nr:gliding motility-associated C-terminal domain-containing protein [Bacteroidales bacterium]
MKRIEKYELIERYLLGTCSDEEKAAVEQKIQAEPEFAGELEQHRQLQNIIIDHTLVEIKDNLKDIRNRHLQKIRKARLFRGMAIVGFCLSILSIFLIMHNKRDIAVRPASEAYKASEAFLDSTSKKHVQESIILNTEEKAEPQRDVPVKIVTQDNIPKVSGNTEQPGEPFNDTKIQPVLTLVTPVANDASIDNPVNLPASGDIPDKATTCNIKAAYIVEPSCNNAPTGIVRVEENSITGGTAPYEVSLNGIFSGSMEFVNLRAGNYMIEISDAAGCTLIIPSVVVEDIECFTKDTKFSPVHEVWEMPLEHGKQGTIIIYNKEGLVVYRLKFNGLNPETWNGNDAKNEALPRGVYPFVVKYDDSKVFQGTVTIVR